MVHGPLLSNRKTKDRAFAHSEHEVMQSLEGELGLLHPIFEVGA